MSYLVGLIRKHYITNEVYYKHARRACLKCHAACKCGFQPLKQSYSQRRRARQGSILLVDSTCAELCGRYHSSYSEGRLVPHVRPRRHESAMMGSDRLVLASLIVTLRRKDPLRVIGSPLRETPTHFVPAVFLLVISLSWSFVLDFFRLLFIYI